ncbi:MAG: Gldg family protein [Planctomycetota bacterium]|jgi:ABC-2 type transport system permease protein
MLKRLPRMFALFKRECLSMAVTSSTYAAVTLFIVIISLGFYLTVVETSTADFEPVSIFISFLCIFFVPIITMKSFSEERRNNTLELLLTSPISILDIIIAKFSASYLFYLIMISPCAVFIILISWAGDVDRGAVITSLTGLMLSGAVYVSIGLFVSSLTKSQIASAMGAIGIIFILWALWFLGDNSSLAGKFIRYLSIKGHFDYSLARGVFDLSDIVYFVTVSFIFIFANWTVLNGVNTSINLDLENKKRIYVVLEAVFLVTFFELFLFGVAYLHINQISILVLKDWLLADSYYRVISTVSPFIMCLGILGAYSVIKRKRIKNIFSILVSHTNVGSTLIGIFCVILLAVNINLLSARYVKRIDISENKLNTLFISTRRTLDELQGPVKISVFYSPYEDEYGGFPLLERTKSLLFEYSAYSGRILVDYYNPDIMPSLCRKMADDKNLDFSRLTNYASVEYQGRTVLLPWEFVSPQEVNVFGKKYRVFAGETAFTSAIKRLIDPRMPVIYFSEQHGEYDSYEKNNNAKSVTKFVGELRIDGFIVKRFSFSGNIKIPDDCDLLIMAGPDRPFSSQEKTSLSEYIENGGRALMLIDPPLAPGLDLGIESVLKRYGVNLNEDLIFDARNNIGGAGGNIIAAGNPEHPVTAGVGRRVYCNIKRGRSLNFISGRKTMKGWTGNYLLTSSQDSVSVSLKKNAGNSSNRSGGFACALALTGPDHAKLVVAGDADIASNLIFNEAHNRAFLLSACHWLLDRDKYRIQIPERNDKDRSLRLNSYKQRIIFWVSLIAVPQLALLLGAFIWWLRKQ